MENSNHFNVIVIGAGISGIGAGYYLKKIVLINPFVY